MGMQGAANDDSVTVWFCLMLVWHEESVCFHEPWDRIGIVLLTRRRQRRSPERI